MMDAMKVAAVLRRAAENAGCGLHEVVSGGGDCPEGSCNGCREVSAAWANEAADAIERCAMPEGVEWPRFEDGKLVRFGDGYVNAKGNPAALARLSVKEVPGSGVVWSIGRGDACVTLRDGDRVKRPDVIAADGEPLEPGQTVWGVDSGKKYDVAWLEGDVAIVDTYEGLASKVFASKLTHQRPVLDADGVPIKKGDTVYWLEHTAPFTVVSPHETRDNDGQELKCGHTVEVMRDGHEPHMYVHPESLHHTKPERPDSRQAVVNEIGDEMAARIDLLVSSGRWSDAD